MRDYQVRFYDARDRVNRTQDLRCESDDTAIDRVAFLHHSHRVELWRGDQLVWRFDHDRPIRR